MKKINSILIANRGEIASRIMRTCRKMGIKSIAVFADADRNAPYVKEADISVHIGESAPSSSYLDQDKIIATAKKTGADAIHPGYGFLSENAAFAQRCEQENIIFIGPHHEAIQAMGSKSKAKSLMLLYKVPIVPGYQGKDQSIKRLSEEAVKIGFPILLKATAGGGGKGMRIVDQETELEKAIEAAKREAQNAFGDDELIIEKYIDSGRHIEFQIFGDQHGNAIHLLERECSIQRRYQKVIEESPSPIMDAKLRTEMGAAAINAAKALQYDNAGTVEFIYDEKSGKYYFLEVNTRLQVEHPVTEEITGLDLVQMQIESAQGQRLAIKQEDVRGKGYAIECRLYAEDATNDFLPVTGTIERFEVPDIEGLRVESAIESGSQISIFYDPMIAKLIVWDNTRMAALRKMQYVLRHLICLGMTTNQDFLLELLENEKFQKGEYDTHFIEKEIDVESLKNNQSENSILAVIAATVFAWQKREKGRTLLSSIPSGWRNNFNDYQKEIFQSGDIELLCQYRFQNDKLTFIIDEKTYEVVLNEISNTSIRIEIDGMQYPFVIAQRGQQFFIQNESLGTHYLQMKDRFPAKEKEQIKGGYQSPMPSQIVKILVKEGDEVKEGDGLIVLSSMKMENTICANEAGKVAEIYVEENTNVEADFLLLKLT